MNKLYHYVHCPYCVRVRMVCGLFNIEYKSVVVDYDDEQTPINLIGKKMLPIWESGDSAPLCESLDIIKKITPPSSINAFFPFDDKQMDEFNNFLGSLGKSIHPLAMPNWIYTKEFNESSRQYFQSKKEKSKGPFQKLYQDKDIYLKKISNDLKSIPQSLSPYYQSNQITIKDICLASHLWGLYIVPEFQFEPAIHNYLQMIKEDCHFDYHQDFWS